MRVFVSWSGGKDSCLALYRALKAGLRIEYLFNMLNEEGSVSRSHGLPKGILDAQAKALGTPIIYGRTSWENYEEEFKKVIRGLKSMGVEGGVFGDINLQEHRDWVEKVCNEIGVEAFEPLWNEEYERLLNEFMGGGFEAIVVSAKADLIGEEWIGKAFNQKFIEYLKSQGLDLCGEKGEYHTLVVYGPIFKQYVKVLETAKTMKDGRWVLQILKFSLL
jgi:uncharacterized protein (TIGR00290 family)